MSLLAKIQGIEAGDRATGDEVLLARANLPTEITKTIPACILGGDSGWDWEALPVLSWVIMKREDKNLTLKTVERLVNKNNAPELGKAVLYFFGDATMEQVEGTLNTIFTTAESSICKTKGCDASLVPAWRYCPMCGKKNPMRAELEAKGVIPVAESSAENPTQ